MARYIMANRRAGKFRENEKIAARESVGISLSSIAADIDVVKDRQPEDPTARRIVVFDTEPGEMEAMLATMPNDVIIEPEILHWTTTLPLMDTLRRRRRLSDDSKLVGSGARTRVTVEGDGNPLEGAQVVLSLRGPGQLERTLQKTTPGSGRVTFEFSAFWRPAYIIAVPAGDYWATVLLGPDGSNITVSCPALPQDGPTGWWHEVHGVRRHGVRRGRGIRVGVADTGIGPHPCLEHATDIGAFIEGSHDPDGGADADSHGSHVCGTIGARPQADGHYAGIAPGVALFSARVFPPNSGARQDDIVAAIDALSRDHEVDLINLSLGSEVPSEIERDAIIDALERGTVCVCAAANSAGPVEWPAAFEETVAVSALGLEGWGPPGTLASFRRPEDPEKFADDNLYLANFSCFGPEITCAGSGVGIISTVPERFGLSAPYGAMGGTSMASPAACASLAAVLSESAEYKNLPRDETRAELAKSLLRNTSRDIGLHSDFQGRGIPLVT